MHGYMEKLTDLRGEGSEGDWKRLAKEHICIYAKPMDTDNNVAKTRGGSDWGRGARREATEDIYNSVNDRN